MHAKPDQQQRENEQVCRTKHEALKLETDRAWQDEAANHEQDNEDRRGQRSLTPAPPYRGWEQRQNEEQYERAAPASGREGEPGEHRHVDAVRQEGQAGVEPPVLPCHHRDQDRPSGIKDQEGIGLGQLRRAATEHDDYEKRRGKHHPAERNHPAAVKLEQAAKRVFLQGGTPIRAS